MNTTNRNTPNNYNWHLSGPSGPQAVYPLVYDKIDNVPSAEVNSLFDFSIIREIKDILKNNLLKKRSGNDQINLIENSWTKLNDEFASKVSIFNDTNETLEIKQNEFHNLINYSHSTSFAQNLTSSVGSGANINYGGWGDFRTAFTINYEMSNQPIIARNTYSYLELPYDFDTKQWEISFDFRTNAPQDWTGWNRNWTLGNGYVLNIFNSWENKPSPIGLFPGVFSYGNSAPKANFYADPSKGEKPTKGYTLFISDPKVRSSNIANIAYPDFAITGAYFSGQGALTSSGTYNLELMTSGLNQNFLNQRVRLAIGLPNGNARYITGLSTNINQTISVPRLIINTDILGTTQGYVNLLLEVEREFPNGFGNNEKAYIPRAWGQLFKSGNNLLWSNFSGISSCGSISHTYWNYHHISGDINSFGQSKQRTVSLYYEDTLLASKSIDLGNYYAHNFKTKAVLSQKGGLFGVYLQNKFNAYDLVLEHYDRDYYAKSKIGNFLGLGSLIKEGSYGEHTIDNVYLNNKRLDLNSQESINNYFNTANIASIKLYPNTAIDMKISNTNQIFIYNSGSGTKNIKYRWES